MCWGGVLSSDWKDARVDHDFGITFNRKNPVERISRMEKAFYPRNDREKSSISYLLPQTEEDKIDSTLGVILSSQVIDGTSVGGFGYVQNHPYKWKMIIESDLKSIAVVPDRFYDVHSNSYPIDITNQVVVNDNLIDPANGRYDKFNIIYRINHVDHEIVPPTANLIIDKSISTSTDTEVEEDTKQTDSGEGYIVTYDKNVAIYNPPKDTETTLAIKEAEYLCIVIDQNDDYHAYVSKDGKTFYYPETAIYLSLFKHIDMWLRFDSINALCYYIITKYENDVNYIGIGTITGEGPVTQEIDTDTLTAKKHEGQLWAYVNPKTMTPYPDDYWFHQGEPYYIKSLTLVPKKKDLKAKRITVTAGQFPGMYMIVGETYIRSRDTGDDERLQLKIPLCKIKSDQTLTLQADGDPTTFSMTCEVARPENGIMMELTSYEIAERMLETEDGFIETKDGSTEVLSE